VKIRGNLWLNSHCPFQTGRCIFYLGIAVLVGSGFHREQAASMNIVKIAVRKFVSALRIFWVAVVDPKMPFRVFSEAMEADELVFFIS